MSKMKKFFAFLLTMTMVLGMATSVFAAPESKSADLTNHVYSAYQIFTGTQAEDSAELGNIEWGEDVDGDAILADLQASSAFVTEEDEVNLFADCETAADVAEVMADWADHSAMAKAFAQIAYNHKIGDGTTVVSGDTSLAAGYYLVVDVTEFAENDEDTVYNLSLLQLTKKGTFEIANKTDVPEVEKEILDPTPMKSNEAGIGETVNYQITGTLPTNFADYEEYYYWFKDDMSKGLTYNNDAKVYVVNGTSEVEVTEYFYIKASDYSDRTGTHIDIKIGDLVCLNALDGVTVNANTKIVVKYSATVNDNAVIAPQANPNEVELKYSNNPDDNGDGKETPDKPGEKEPTTDHPTGETPKDKVKTYVTEVTINKIDGATREALEGAEFTLIGTNTTKVIIKTGEDFVADAEGTYYKLADGTFTTEAPKEDQYDGETLVFENNRADYDADALAAGTMYKRVNTSTAYVESQDEEGKKTSTIKATTGEDGKITFTGLTAGEYTLVESVTPAGYNTIDDIEFTIDWTEADGFTVDSNDAEFTGDQTFSVTVENNKGTTLPETGGMGTTIFYVVGTVLVMIAGVLLITKRRMVAR